MKAIKRIIASVFVCMFAVTGGLNALALTPTEDSSTVVSQPVSEGISSETSSQTGSVSSGLSSRADDSGLKNESSSSRTPEASSEVDSENSQSSSEPVSSGNNSTSLSASAGMPSAEISSSTEAKQAATTVDVSYKTHVQTFGWQDWAANGASAGTTGLAKRLEAIQIKTSAPASQGGIRYRTHVQTYGWLDWVSDGASSGTTGEAKRLEAIQIELTGALATQYDVYYRVHAQTFGWLDWACNGASAGSAGYAKRLEAIQIVLVPKGGKAPGSTAAPYKELPPAVSYQSYLSGAWQNSVLDNAVSGTVGQAKQIEGIKISLQDKAVSFAGSSIQYRTYLQTYAWQDWTSNGGTSGKPGSGKRVEAVQIKLTGSIASSYDVYYRVHSQTFGWLDWACNGQSAGSAGYAKRIEAIQIVLVKKGGAAPGSTATPYKEAPPSVTYQTYISGGWQPAVADKATSGLAGQGKKTEGLRVSLKAGAQSLGNSSVKYRTYLQTYGWQSWVSNGASSAKAGSGKRMEAIEISLTGDISSQYDIYYRSYVTGYGWLGWACNGATSGTTDYAKPIEAVQAVLVKKGGAAPGSTSNAYLKPEVTGPFEISFSPSGASNFGGLVSIEPDHDVILVASAKGGAGGYQYRYRAELIGGSIQTLKDYSGSSSYTWRPNTPGQYKMYVDVKDSTGTVKTAMFQMSVGLSGIDVSSWQGTIDWKKVKAAGIDYAIIRAGYGKEDIDKQTDSTFVQNIKGAKEAGMPFGLYHFSHASTVEEAKQEANFLLEILETNGVTPDDLAYPIAFDIEGKAVSPSKEVNTGKVTAFCEIIRDAGYLPMVYASKTVIQDYLYYDEISANNIWMAAWTSTPNDTEIFDNCFPVDMWQYSESGTVDGINGRVDLNICYTTVFRDGSADTTQKGKVVVDAGSSLNVRKAPSVNADVVGSLYKDDIVTIISETSGWYQIVTSTGVSGYVSAEYIQKI